MGGIRWLLRKTTMAPSTVVPESEPTVTVTVTIPREHALIIRGDVPAGDLESSAEIISNTSRAVFKAVKALPAKALSQQPATSTPTVPKAAASSSRPEVQRMLDSDPEFTIEIKVNLPDPPPSVRRYYSPHAPPRPLPYQFTVTPSTTVHNLAFTTALRIGCSMNRLQLVFGNMVMWDMQGSPNSKVLPGDTTLSSIGISKINKHGIYMSMRPDTQRKIETEMVRPHNNQLGALKPQDTETFIRNTVISNTFCSKPEKETKTSDVTKSSADSNAPAPSVSRKEEKHQIYVEVWRLQQSNEQLTPAPIEQFTVQASTTLKTLAGMTAARANIKQEEQILCFEDIILQSFMPDFEATVSSDTTLGSLGVIGAEEHINMIYRMPEMSPEETFQEINIQYDVPVRHTFKHDILLSFTVSTSTTVMELAAMIAEKESIPTECHSIYFKGKVISQGDPNVTLHSLGITEKAIKAGGYVLLVPHMAVADVCPKTQDETRAPTTTTMPPLRLPANLAPASAIPQTPPIDAALFITVKVIFESETPSVREKDVPLYPWETVDELILRIEKEMLRKLNNAYKSPVLTLNGRALSAHKTLDQLDVKNGALLKMTVWGAEPSF